MKVSSVGSSPHRVGGVERVTGRQRYVADIKIPDVLHAKLVTLECARARILSIDTTEAERIPAVQFVMTPDDLPKPMPRFGPWFEDRPVLADGETKFHGEAVAAVVAQSLESAELAARAVRVEYEELNGGVFSVTRALDPSAPLVQDPRMRPGDPLADTNVLREHVTEWGDLNRQNPAVVIENMYRFPMITQFAIEPHAFVAAPDDGGVAVWSTIQHPFQLQKTLAKILGLPLAKVRVFAPDPGGGFGGKQIPKLEPLVAFLALHAERPVRLVLTLEETFQTLRRPSAEIRVKTGLLDDGTMVTQEVEANFLIGPFADIADRIVAKSSHMAAGPYRVPAARIVGRTLLSHTTPATAMRGFGTPQVTWARESNIDEAARVLGIDRLDIRLHNLASRGDDFHPFEKVDGEWAETVRVAADWIEWGEPLPEGRGRGLAIGIKGGPMSGLSYATIRVLADGSAVISAGTSDMGQGARTVFAQIVSDELGVPVDRISVVMGDTKLVPYDEQTSASRSSVLMGTAILRACRDVQAQVRAMAARLDGTDESQIVVEDGLVRIADNERPLVEVLKSGLGLLGGEVMGRGEMRKDIDPDHPLGGSVAFFELNCTACEVEVDRGTGEVTVIRHVTVGDAGKALNPTQTAGQDEGAAIMGLSHTLMEHLVLDDVGKIRNLGAIDYRIVTSMDLPGELHSENIENSDGPGPYGAKGISEGGLLATAPAVASAVQEATGAVIRELPLTPERVWRALHGL